MAGVIDWKVALFALIILVIVIKIKERRDLRSPAKVSDNPSVTKKAEE